MAAVVYALCALVAGASAFLLLRAFGRTHARLLLWSGLCFVGLTLNNALVFLDLIVVPTVDLYTVRNLAAVAAMLVLLYGLIWDAR